jgi:hypothetical protein
MPVELLKLNLQLENLKILYEDAIDHNASVEELKNIKDKIEITEILILNRKELIKQNESPN